MHLLQHLAFVFLHDHLQSHLKAAGVPGVKDEVSVTNTLSSQIET